nr:phosphopentomutase [Acidobacteriota bacterium]
ELYRYCEIAFEQVGLGLGVGRVIARPFAGAPGSFARTSRRHDYARAPSAPTLLDRLTEAGHPVIAVGKIADLFAGRGISRHLPSTSDDEGMDAVELALREIPRGFIWANLVDCDQLFGHRNDVGGYARNLERIDGRLADLLPLLDAADLLMITADHGNDPTTPSTDHSREYVPLLVAGAGVAPGVRLGTRRTFADLGQTIAEIFAVPPLAHGTSFLAALGGAASA